MPWNKVRLDWLFLKILQPIASPFIDAFLIIDEENRRNQR